jgi:TetR/AcrR family transcriptional regulator, transcriptional repressor for nem operon
MRVDRKTMAEHRAAILRQAERLFRQHGIDGVAVADITSAAGLTHGAFYGHFPSKAALAAESCRHSLETSARFWRERASAARAEGEDPLGALIASYLTPERRDRRETSCMLASIGPEASRDPELGPALAIGVTALTAALQELIAERQPDADPKQHYQAALAVLAALSGGLNLARALSADPERSAAALQSAAGLAKRAAECQTPAE